MPKETPNQPYIDPKPTLNRLQTNPKTNPTLKKTKPTIKKAKPTLALNQSDINTKTNLNKS